MTQCACLQLSLLDLHGVPTVHPPRFPVGTHGLWVCVLPFMHTDDPGTQLDLSQGEENEPRVPELQDLQGKDVTQVSYLGEYWFQNWVEGCCWPEAGPLPPPSLCSQVLPLHPVWAPP